MSHFKTCWLSKSSCQPPFILQNVLFMRAYSNYNPLFKNVCRQWSSSLLPVQVVNDCLLQAMAINIYISISKKYIKIWVYVFDGGIGPSSDESLETPLLSEETMLVVSRAVTNVKIPAWPHLQQSLSVLKDGIWSLDANRYVWAVFWVIHIQTVTKHIRFSCYLREEVQLAA